MGIQHSHPGALRHVAVLADESIAVSPQSLLGKRMVQTHDGKAIPKPFRGDSARPPHGPAAAARTAGDTQRQISGRGDRVPHWPVGKEEEASAAGEGASPRAGGDHGRGGLRRRLDGAADRRAGWLRGDGRCSYMFPDGNFPTRSGGGCRPQLCSFERYTHICRTFSTK